MQISTAMESNHGRKREVIRGVQQITGDAAHPVIVAHRLVTTSIDYGALDPLVEDIFIHIEHKLREVSGDAGFGT